jgi:hypothetical protein
MKNAFPISIEKAFIFLSERRDSDPRPRPWQGRALPAELLSLILIASLFREAGRKYIRISRLEKAPHIDFLSQIV